MLNRLQWQMLTGEIGMDEWSATVTRLLEEANDRDGDPVLSHWLWPALQEQLDLVRTWERAALTSH